MELSISEQKKILRKTIKILKSQYSENKLIDKSNQIFISLENILTSSLKNSILAYWSMPDEVHTHQWIIQNYHKKNIYLPAINNDELEIKLFTGINNMKAVPPFGILEPTGEPFKDLNKIEIILVPGMAFDRRGFRMGRGKGYYDKFLPKTSALRIGICYSFQLFETIPINEYDAQMDYILTENEVLIINNKAL
ncbi:MAG: 5-formyltetrahydrofolate cyclo-ligase [Bacteroidales bacterium]